jgi:ABC-type proline/glycine betaine transport system permease subunit
MKRDAFERLRQRVEHEQYGTAETIALVSIAVSLDRLVDATNQRNKILDSIEGVLRGLNK